MLTIIDNYDSFTYNLVHYFGDLGVEMRVYRNDEKTAAAVLGEKPEAIVMSPGPCTPNEAGICLELVKKNKGRIPLLGVCLGHQTIGQAFGGRVIRAPVLMHGKLSNIYHEGTSLFRGLESGFEATRYHSLIVEAATLPDCLTATAHTSDGLIMALEQRTSRFRRAVPPREHRQRKRPRHPRQFPDAGSCEMGAAEEGPQAGR